ncbi:MarR family winged helix-turn-helix transcriptional regulator [Clostridium thailandense]|uniref:MarR family winged helix-turn-helix transcriptional regulator n=1 Tax=Clostridium thailandense TaxID=2794346 RepID=UPI00398A26C6
MGEDSGIDIEAFGQALGMTFRLVSNRISSKFKVAGYVVTPEQYMILNCLYKNGELQQNQISKLTAKDEPCISRIVNNMIKNGIVERVQHPNDKRTNLICLTKKAKEIEESLHNECLLALSEAVKNIPSSNIKIFESVLYQIISNLK